MLFMIIFTSWCAYLVINSFAATAVCSSTQAADINCDNSVNVIDLSILLSNWNKTTAELAVLTIPYPTRSDINSSGKVDIVDLSILLSDYGTTTSTPSSIYWGAWIDGDTYSIGSSDAPWSASTTGGSWDLFEQHAGKKVSVLHYGQPPMWSQAFAPGTASLITNRGAIPFMDMSSQSVPLTDVTSGKYDSSIITWAQAVKSWGKPFFFRWNWEMNGTWFDWGNQAKANPANYIAAWRHMHDVVTAQGASNVTWVWCPNTEFTGSTPLSQLYPGDSYVDWTCVDGYNWGSNPYKTDSWKSFNQVFQQTYNSLLTIAPTKPIIIGETSTTEYGGSKASWITDALTNQLPKNYPKVKGLVWFNWNIFENGGRMDWPIETTSTAQAAFANGIANPYYSANSYGNLPALTKVQPIK